jgi:flagellar biosynthetic protein FliQ
MEPQTAIDLGREAMSMALLVSAPVLLVGIGVGLLIGLLQALTQIQDQTLSFVPKILAMLTAFAIGLPWLIQRMVEYSGTLISNIPRVVLGS